jgi:hypothetical protein
MRKLMFLATIIVSMAAFNCSKSSSAAAAAATASSGGSGLDGTGVFTQTGTGIGTPINVYSGATAASPAGTVAIPTDAKYVLLHVGFVVKLNETVFPGSTAVKFNLTAVDRALATNKLSYGAVSVARSTSNDLEHTQTMFMYLTDGGTNDLRGKNIGFYQDTSNNGVVLGAAGVSYMNVVPIAIVR